ncbi:MAG TPA: hypothetical protein VG204_00970 [Terriglobia bacterium]|nr:hypothetical protein [Terriglobia bacterium]
MLAISVLATCVVAGLLIVSSPPRTKAAGSWDPKAAAAYLDQRANWWMTWPVAARDHGTFCVSCHTAVPYAVSRSALRGQLGEKTLSANEEKLLANVTKRVRLWKDVAPFYNDKNDGPGKAVESRGTEAVLNALILATYDARRGELSSDTRAAFDNMWAAELTTGDKKGAWPWLQFNNEPWEANDSAYYGAALAAVAVGTAPGNYRSMPEIQDNLKLLGEYLVGASAAQTPLNRVVLLWASAKLPGLLAPARQESIIKEALAKQQPDGGWSLASLVAGWKRADGTPQETKSDGYATGLVSLALEEAGLPRGDVHLKQGLAWLANNQNPTDGLWPASSLNKQRDPSTYIGRFMSDAATAYAVLALTGTTKP